MQLGDVSVSALAQPLRSSGSSFSALPRKYIGHRLTCRLVFRCRGFFPFSCVHGALKARTLTWFASPSRGGPRFTRTAFYQVLTGGDVPLCHSLRQDDMPGAPGVPQLVLVEPVNLHPLPGLNLGAALGPDKALLESPGEGVQGRLELGSEDAPSWSTSRLRCSRWLPWGCSAPAGLAAG